jgi:hypothetical protein
MRHSASSLSPIVNARSGAKLLKCTNRASNSGGTAWRNKARNTRTPRLVHSQDKILALAVVNDFQIHPFKPFLSDARLVAA